MAKCDDCGKSVTQNKLNKQPNPINNESKGRTLNIKNLNFIKNERDVPASRVSTHQYDKFYYYLMSIPFKTKALQLTFSEIAEILKTNRLCNAAYNYDAWWSNNDSHPLAKRWLAAGWLSIDLNRHNKCVTLKRD